MHHVTIFSKDNCPQCIEAEQALRELDCKIKVLKLEKDFTMDDIHLQFPNARSFPQFSVNGFSVDDIEDVLGYII